MKKRTTEQLQEELSEAQCSSYDGRRRIVADSADVEADGETWAVISDHGNAELCHRGRNGRLYWHGGLV
jgi:hypothetical protein